MKKQIKRWLAFLMVLTMCLTILPGNVLADETVTAVTETAAESVMETEETVEMSDVGETAEFRETSAEAETETETEIQTAESEAAVETEISDTEESERGHDVVVLEERKLHTMFDTSDIIYGSGGGITRAEWLHNLAVMFNMTVDSDNIPDNYYSDVDSSHTYYDDIMLTVEFGVVNIEAGGELCPDDPATRDFAASTLAFCLGIQLDAGAGYSFSDSSDCSDPDSAQIAVDRGWFSLSGGQFLPGQAITSGEVTAMADDAQVMLAYTYVEEGYDSQYVFADFVVVVPESATVYVDDNDVVTISDTTITVAEGDTFVIWLSGIPCFFVAESVTTLDGVQTITTSEADVDAALLDVDASESIEVDLSEFEGAEGFETTYIATQAQAERAIQTYGISVSKGSVMATKNFELSNGLKVTFACNLSNLKLNQNVFSKSNCYVSEIGRAHV